MSRRVWLSRRGRVLVLCGVVWLLAPTLAGAVPPGEWVATGPPVSILLAGGSLVTLTDGTPLLFGLGAGTVQRYHLDDGTWTASGTLQVQRPTGATVTVLPSGLVLIAGGSANEADARTELYDPRAGTSVLVGAMKIARSGHQATLLASGEVLVAGGTGADGHLVGPAEIYDPNTATWTLTGVLNQFRTRHAAVRLPSGEVLVAGGEGASGTLASAEIYDRRTGSWSPAGVMDRPALVPMGVVLTDGRVLVVQGSTGPLFSQLYDRSSNTWAPSVSIKDGSQLQFPVGLIVLRDGRPLLISGVCQKLCSVASPGFFFDAQTGQWSAAPAFAAPGGSLVGLADGRALMVSGTAAFAQLFRPDDSTPRLVVSPGAVNFGTTSPGVPVQQALNVQNTGGAILIGRATTAPPFSVVSGSPFTLAPGASATVVLRFTPSIGSFSDVVQFVSNGNWQAVSVTGDAGLHVSGRVTDASGAGVAAVTVKLAGGGNAQTLTDATGRYRFSVGPNNGYNVTPTSSALSFAPSTRSVLVGTQDVNGLDFTIGYVDGVAAFVGGLYDNVLNGAPDAAGLESWVSFLRQHCNQNGFVTVADGFFDSVEFRTLHSEFRTSPPLTLAGLVKVLYRSLLARDPDPGGLAGYIDFFRSGRRQAAIGFVDSGEFAGLLPDRTNRAAVTAVVARLYTEILGRAPDAAGLTGWVDYILASRDVEGAVAGFVTSPEFETHGLTFRDYATRLYRGILGREPDQAGLDGWENFLVSGLLFGVNQSFIPSGEFQGRIPRVCGS